MAWDWEFRIGSFGWGVWVMEFGTLVRWAGLRYLNHIHIMFDGIKSVALVIRNYGGLWNWMWSFGPEYILLSQY